MPAPAFITVTAPPDRVTPVHATDGTAPGGGQLRVTADVVARVRYRGSQAIRRAIARGDLIPCDMNGASVASAEAAASEVEHAEGAIRPMPKKAVSK